MHEASDPDVTVEMALRNVATDRVIEFPRARELVILHLKGMRTTLLRPPDFYWPDSELSSVRGIFDAALKGGTADVIGPIDTPHEFIFVPDLAETLIALSEKDEAYGNTWNVSGPELITTRQFADLVFDAVQQKPRLRVAGKFMLRVGGLFNPVLRELVEMHYLWTTPVKLDDTRLRQLLPNLHKTPYPDGIRQTIDAKRGLRRLPLAGSLLCGRLLPGGAEKRRHNYQEHRTQIYEGLEILLQNALWQVEVAPQCRLRLHGFRLVGGSESIGHGRYPLRVNSIRFFPSST